MTLTPMTLTVTLTPELSARLSRYADATGKPAEAVVADLLETLPALPLTPEPAVTPESAAPNRRIAGLHEGNVLWMSDDFDEPFPDEFWDSPIFPEVMVLSEPTPG